jgi:predicted RNA-binding protein with PUA-like domain
MIINGDKMAYWLFQSNPQYYRIFDAIQDFAQIHWTVNRFQKEMSIGDGILIWVSGRKEAGIYALAKLIETPKMLDYLPDLDYWIDNKRNAQDIHKLYAIIQVTYQLLEHPLLKDELKKDAILQELNVISQPQSTNYRVTLEQWERVQSLINFFPENGLTDISVEGSDEGDIFVEPQSVSLDKSDRSLSEYHRWFRQGRLIVNPEWQREYVWDLKKASRLIESFLIGLPVPVIYFAFNEEGSREVIDGLQRLTSVFKFFDNDYALRGLEVLRQFNGFKFSELPREYQNHLEDCTMRAFELPKDTNKDFKFMIFERLNTGGVVLNEMEIRNCLYSGSLNDLIRELAKSSEFLKCVNQNNLEKRMKDRGLILRFLAFLQMNHRNAKKGMKNFLNDFLDAYRYAGKDKLLEFRESFKKAMKAAYTVFGNQAFRLRTERGSWATQVNASIFQVLSVSFVDYDLGAITRVADSIYEEYLDLISTDDKWVSCVTTSTGDISRIDYSFTAWKQRLTEIMEMSSPNDSQRLFSRKLKEELFNQNSTCQICQQKISLINDAALDHDLHYWRGGKTIPENARLVHRQCNLERQH